MVWMAEPIVERRLLWSVEEHPGFAWCDSSSWSDPSRGQYLFGSVSSYSLHLCVYLDEDSSSCDLSGSDWSSVAIDSLVVSYRNGSVGRSYTEHLSEWQCPSRPPPKGLLLKFRESKVWLPTRFQIASKPEWLPNAGDSITMPSTFHH